MADTTSDPTVISKWDPVLTKHVVDVMRPIVRRYFRSEVRGLENIPQRGCLVVANHSGGMLTPDWSVFAVAYYDTFGYDRPIYALAHDLLFAGAADRLLNSLGIIRANRENAAQALASDSVVLVFPGGDYDVYRPTKQENVIGFAGRTGYVTSAIEAGAPIVPMVYIGGQESQLYLSRGRWLSHALHLTRLERKLGRTDILPITFGFPFGLSVLLPVNVPLPTKITGQVLPPIDIAAAFGDDPDVDRVDAHVRAVMQTALARLARKRRLPVVG
jgi:1-acyl-sn-glycerol-3-phosphate acyltransferase